MDVGPRFGYGAPFKWEKHRNIVLRYMGFLWT